MCFETTVIMITIINVEPLEHINDWRVRCRKNGRKVKRDNGNIREKVSRVDVALSPFEHGTKSVDERKPADYKSLVSVTDFERSLSGRYDCR